LHMESGNGKKWNRTLYLSSFLSPYGPAFARREVMMSRETKVNFSFGGGVEERSRSE